MSLFQSGDFTLHSGQKSNFKIDCDALTDEDIEHLALQFAWRLRFEEIVGIPRGGLRLAAALEKYAGIMGPLLIVDDVLTTGASMEAKRQEILAKDPDMPIIGAVIFSRMVPPPSWITPLFVMNDYTRG